MRETRPSGSEGGEAQSNEPSLPLLWFSQSTHWIGTPTDRRHWCQRAEPHFQSVGRWTSPARIGFSRMY